MIDPIQRLLRLRRRAVEQARLALAACLREEADAASRLQSIEDSIRRDQDATALLLLANPSLGPTLTLGRAQAYQQRAAAVTALAEAEARTTTARASVADARARAEAVVSLLDTRASVAAGRAEQRAAHALDDVVRSRRMRQQRNS